MKILVIDVGGTHVKVLATGHEQRIEFSSGKKMTPSRMVAAVQAAIIGWEYDAVPGARLGDNSKAFEGGHRLWTEQYGGSSRERFAH